MTPRTRQESRRLAERVARAGAERGALRTLLLDVDGTLAPIAPTPDRARVPAETLSALRSLVRHGWRVAVVSGRPASQVRRLVPLRGVRVFGSHGLEGHWGTGRAGAIDPALSRRMESLARRGRSLAAGTRGAQVERKAAGVAFHDRNVPPGALRSWRRRLRQWLETVDLSGLEVLGGRRVVELRLAGAHKGVVVRRLLRGRRSTRRDDSLVAIGDDRTDEDLFREVGSRGLTIRVGRAGVRTAATERLASPTAVRRFLVALAELVS